jgi:A/G-specific adenine glycosylase
VGDSVYIRKREEKDIWQNLHEFILLEKDEPDDRPADEFLSGFLQAQPYSLKMSSDPCSQQLTHQRINGRFFHVMLSSRIKMPGNYQLVKKRQLKNYAFPKFINSYLENNHLQGI